MKPEFIDNRNGNTLARAITGYLAMLRQTGQTPEMLSIATAYFNPQGLEYLAAETEHLGKIRLLIGAEPLPEEKKPRRRIGEDRRTYQAELLRHAHEDLRKGLKEDRNYLPFDFETQQGVRRLIDYLRSGKVEVRRYVEDFLHAKAFLFHTAEKGLIHGSSNLTAAGLRTNMELNLGHYDPVIVDRVDQWYEELWDRSEPFDLAAIYAELLQNYPPFTIYLKVLWHLYGEELEREEEETSGRIPVLTFQKHGVWRARRILKRYGGVIIADGVGLGKTYLAGELMQSYIDNRQRVLLICPAALRDTTWRDFVSEYQLFVETASYHQLANEKQLGGDRRILDRDLVEYALVVIDEAHNYRNPDTPDRAAVLRQLLAGKRRDVVMLTATPVNNSLWDLYHLLHYFLKQDAALAEYGIISLRDRFNEAMREDPFDLNPDLLYPVIDATTVKRTRKFIKTHYANDMITAENGSKVPIVFPKPHAVTITYDLEAVLPGFFDRFREILMPEGASAKPLLTMARYMPGNYPAGKEPNKEDTALVGLIRSGLLKRFESSMYAFRRSLERMIGHHRIFIEQLERGRILGSELLREISAADDEADIDALVEEQAEWLDAADFNMEALKADVASDMALLEELKRDAEKVRADNSPKLKRIVEELVDILHKAEYPDEEVAQLRRKVLIFSYFEETIDWLETHLNAVVERDERLAPYRGRIASVSGADERYGVQREDAIFGFAPWSTKAVNKENRFDILLCTDVLAEGMNLQDCQNIINYDLPWNPMRLVQRHGRIDRINSRHNEVYLRTFFPDLQLDALLNLEERVRRKLAQAAASIGVEVSPIEDGALGEQTFSETREEIEKLYQEDADLYERGGTDSAAQTGEEYRQTLRRGLDTHGDYIRDLPMRIGSGMIKGDRKGHFFCAAVGERVYLRFVPFDGGAIVSELGTCLRVIECEVNTALHMPADLANTVFSAWEKARQSIYGKWMFETDPANLQPRLRKLNREVAEFLRTYPPTDISEKKLRDAIDSVQSPWSRREENQLRHVFDTAYDSNEEKSRHLVKVIEALGIEPFQAPEPLPPIEPDDISLVCWMAIDAAVEQ